MSMNAVNDIVGGLRQHGIWLTRAIWDIRRRYSESILGPLWMSAGLAALAIAVGFILGRDRGENYIVYVTAGFLVWYFCTGVLSGSLGVFREGRAQILHAVGPMSTHVFRLAARELIVFGHNFVVFLIIAYLFGTLFDIQWLYILPGLALVVVNILWMGLIVACLASLFDDVTPAVQYSLMLLMFMTPLFWYPEGNLHRAAFITYNPFYYIVTAVRQPLLGEPASMAVWGTCVVLAVVGWMAALTVFQMTRDKIALAL